MRVVPDSGDGREQRRDEGLVQSIEAGMILGVRKARDMLLKQESVQFRRIMTDVELTLKFQRNS